MLHTPLNPPGAATIKVLHRLGKLWLHVEGQPLFGPSGQIVQLTAHGPKMHVRLVKQRHLLRCKNLLRDQMAYILNLVQIFGDPVKRLQVPDTALTLLNVRLQHIAGITHFLVPFVSFPQLSLDELALTTLRNLAPETLA